MDTFERKFTEKKGYSAKVKEYDIALEDLKSEIPARNNAQLAALQASSLSGAPANITVFYPNPQQGGIQLNSDYLFAIIINIIIFIIFLWVLYLIAKSTEHNFFVKLIGIGVVFGLYYLYLDAFV